MSAFDKPNNKKDNIKILSEKEIQEKLYGFYHHDESEEPEEESSEEKEKIADLKSVEVTPAGMVQQDFLNTSSQETPAEETSTEDTPTTGNEEVLNEEELNSFPENFEVSIDDELNLEPVREEIFNDPDIEEATKQPEQTQAIENSEISETPEAPYKQVSQPEPVVYPTPKIKNQISANQDVFSKLIPSTEPVVEKVVKKKLKPRKKKKNQIEELKKKVEPIVVKAIDVFKVVFSVVSKGVTGFFYKLGQSRVEFRRIPTKAILITLAGIGTLLLVINLWQTSKQDSGEITSSKKIVAERSTVITTSSGASSKPKAPVKKQQSVKRESKSVIAPIKKYFSIQICVAQTEEGANKVVQNLKQEKLKAFVDPTLNQRGKEIYRVMIGKYENFKESKSDLARYKNLSVMEPYQDSFIRNLKP